MNRPGRTATLLVAGVVTVAVSLTALPALAQEGDEAGGAGGGGISAVLVFVSGGALLVYSAEKLISYLVGTARSLNVSVFLLSLIFTGIEFDDIFLGVVLGLEGLGGVALGIVFGTALSLTGVTLAVAAIVRPFRVDVPRDYLALLALSPLALLPFLLSGSFGPVAGLVLLASFLAFLAYIYVRESGRETPVFQNAEVRDMVDGGAERPLAVDIPFGDGQGRSGRAAVCLSVLALAGLVVGAATTGMGTEGILQAYGLEGTIFGATIATAVLTIEDVLLTVEPVRRGAAEVGIGNVIGSVVFSVTGKLGIIALAGSIVVTPLALTWHLPALVLLTWLAAYFAYTGRLGPRHGYTLLGLYATYWVVSLLLFGTLPVEV